MLHNKTNNSWKLEKGDKLFGCLRAVGAVSPAWYKVGATSGVWASLYDVQTGEATGVTVRTVSNTPHKFSTQQQDSKTGDDLYIQESEYHRLKQLQKMRRHLIPEIGVALNGASREQLIAIAEILNVKVQI